jgi:hypothetical protein
LYDATDEGRGSFALDKFRKIKVAKIRGEVGAKIARLAAE